MKKVGAAHDVGKAINPTGCLQQIEGSIIMGLGHALMEEMIYEDGKLRNGNMVDYKVPTFMDSDVEMKITLVEQAARQTLIEKDSFAPPDLFLVVKGVCELYSAFSLAGDNHPRGLYGVKGIGEPGLAPTAAAIVNAVCHACRRGFHLHPHQAGTHFVQKGAAMLPKFELICRTPWREACRLKRRAPRWYGGTGCVFVTMHGERTAPARWWTSRNIPTCRDIP